MTVLPPIYDLASIYNLETGEQGVLLPPARRKKCWESLFTSVNTPTTVTGVVVVVMKVVVFIVGSPTGIIIVVDKMMKC